MESAKIFEMLFDDGAYTLIEPSFATESCDAAFGNINGVNVYSFYQKDGNGYTAEACSKIIRLYSLATKTGSPIVGFYSSRGVDLNGGFEVLDKYSELLNKAFSVSGVVPQISVITGECLGIATVISNTADIVIGVKNTDYYVVPNGSGTADSAYSDGVIDVLADNEAEAAEKVRTALSYLPQNNLSSLPEFEFTEPEGGSDLINNVSDGGSVFEVKGGFANGVDTAFATVYGTPAGFVKFNGCAICSACAEKAAQFIKLCDAYGVPVITVADSEGVNESASVNSLTALSSAYANATCPKISLITSQSVGSAYILLAGKGANADYTIAWNGAVSSPLPADSAVAFLYGERLAEGEDRKALENEYKAGKGSAATAAVKGVIDEIIAPENTREKLGELLNVLSSKRETTIPRKHTVK